MARVARRGSLPGKPRERLARLPSLGAGKVRAPLARTTCKPGNSRDAIPRSKRALVIHRAFRLCQMRTCSFTVGILYSVQRYSTPVSATRCVSCSSMVFMAKDDCWVIEVLKGSPWPLTIPEIADLLSVDEKTAAMALKLLRDAGRVKLEGCRWKIV